jgi:hypothetical protein
MKIIGFVYEIDATCINVRAFGLGAFQKKTKARTGRPRIWYQVLPVFFYFFFRW